MHTLRKISGQWFDSGLITKTDNWRYASIFFSSRYFLLVLFTETADHMVHSASSLPWKDLVIVAGQLNYVGNVWVFPNVRGWPQTTTVFHYFHQFLSCFVILHDHLPAVVLSKIITCWLQFIAGFNILIILMTDSGSEPSCVNSCAALYAWMPQY